MQGGCLRKQCATPPLTILFPCQPSAALIHTSHRTALLFQQLKEMIADESRPIFVAVDAKNEVAGYAFCIFQQHINDNILTDIKTLYIDDLCVDEQIRGQHTCTNNL